MSIIKYVVLMTYESIHIRSDEEIQRYTKIWYFSRPRVFHKRYPSKKLFNNFNLFVFDVLKSNIDFQIITEEYTRSAHVECVNESNRGISNLQRTIIEVMNENPEFDIVEITRKMSVNMLNTQLLYSITILY